MYIREAFPSTSDPKMVILPGFVQKVKCMKAIQQNEHMTHIYMRSSKTQLERKANTKFTPQASESDFIKRLGENVG